MQATLDKYYRKSRGPSSSSKNKFAHKGPSKRLFTDEKLKLEPLDETQAFVPSQSSVEIDNLCSIPTTSRKIEPVTNDEGTKIVSDVSKTPSSRLLNKDRCATPTRSPATQTVLQKDEKLKSEPLEETQAFVPSPPSVEIDNLCSTPTTSRQIEPVTHDDTKEIVSDVSKTLSSRLLNEGCIATSSRSPATQTVIRKDEKLKSEPLDVAQAFVPSQPSVEIDNLCSIPSTSRQIEPVTNDDVPEIIGNVLKTPSSRFLNEGRSATPTRSPATQTVLRKQLRLGEYSRVLRDSKRTESRKRTIDRSEDSETSPTSIRRSMNDIYASPKLRKFNMVEVEITSPVKRGTLKPRRLFDTSIASSPQKNQSYISPSKLLASGPIRSPQPSPRKLNLERPDYLLAEGKEALVLPRKFLDLEETFHWIELVTKIRAGRHERITFNSIQNDVRKGTRRRFTEEHLAKIKAVYPDAFNLSRQLVKLPMNREKSYELIIDIPDHASNLEREKAFHDCLIERTKIHHQKFLEQYDPTLQIPASEVKRWHREFNLNDVPDIEPTPLPKAPSTNDVPLSAKDLLEKTHAIASANIRLERALSSISEEKADTNPPKPSQPASPALSQKIAARQKSLKGIPQGLLEKIRAKEAAKYAQDMTRTPAEAKEAIMLSRLPDIAKILRVLFVKEKKSILPEELVLRVVGQSYKEKMPAKELKEHLELLSKHQPGWINSCKVENKPYVRVSKDADMTRVLGRLQKLIEAS